MAKNEAKIKFTAETGSFNDAIKRSNQAMSELRAELRLNETQMKASGDAVAGLENKHAILEKQLDASKNKTEALEQKLQTAVRIFGENSQEASNLRTQLLNAQNAEEKLRIEIKKCETALEEQRRATDATETATDELENSLNDVRDASDNASEGFTIMKGAMAELVADGIEKVVSGLGEIATEAFTMATDMGEATNTFIAKTGESADSAEEFEGIMTSIYNGNYGESFEDIAESMATVKTSLGDLSNDELEKITTDALVLRDTFDMDVNESVRAVNSMMDQFGISADEAFALVAQGAQNGLNQNGDLLDVVNEYAVQFKNAGFSAEDMFNMLANGVDAGTWSVDKLGDAVKEANIRISDGTVSDAIKENAKAFGLSKTEAKKLADEVKNGGVGAYQKLSDTLKGVDDDTKRYQLGVELFGTMWEDLGEDAVMALLNTEGEISKTSDALQEINDVKYSDLGSALEGVKRNLQTSLTEPIKNDVMPAVNEFVENTDWQGVGETIGSAFGAIVEGAMAIGGAMASAIGWMNEHKAVVATIAAAVGILTIAIGAYNAVQAVKMAMEKANVTTLGALIAAHWVQATAAMAAIAPYVLIVAAIAAVIAIIVLCIKYWDEIVAAVGRCVDWISEKWSEFTSWLDANVIQPVAEWFRNLWSGIKNVFSNVGSWFSEKFQSAKNGVTNAWSSVKGWFSNVYSGIKNTFSNVGSWFKEKFNSAKTGVTNTWQSVTGFFGNIYSGIKNTFAKVKDAIFSPFKTAIDKVKGIFSSLKLSFPSIKLPHFTVTPKGWKIGDLLKGSIPKLGISWYADGGIFTKPTIFNTPYGLKGVGEAGAEAVLPINRLEGYIANAIEKTQQTANMAVLADAIVDLASRPVELKVNDRTIATTTAGASDRVNGLRSTLISRGLVLD